MCDTQLHTPMTMKGTDKEEEEKKKRGCKMAQTSQKKKKKDKHTAFVLFFFFCQKVRAPLCALWFYYSRNRWECEEKRKRKRKAHNLKSSLAFYLPQLLLL